MKFAIPFAMLLALFVHSHVHAQVEGAIRQADQNLFVRGRVNQELLFSVTGQLSDRCRVFLPNGQRFADRTLADLRNSPFCLGSFQNSGGNWTLRLRFNALPIFNGGRVVLLRPGFGVIDFDPILLQ